MRTRVLPAERAGAQLMGAGLGLFFVVLELLKAQRASQWSGLLPRDWAGLALGFAAYTIVIAVLIAAVRFVWNRARGGASGSGALRDASALLASGATVWVLLSVHREQTPTPDDAVVAASLLGLAALLALGVGYRRCTASRFGVLLAAFGLAGIAALAAAGEYFLYDPDRAQKVTVIPMAWLCLSGLLLAGAQIAARRSAVVAITAACIVLPPFAVWFLLHVPARGAGEARPNLVFLVADTLRADYCSAYGGAVPTPNLERLAARGARFDACYSLAPWTLPSMTGLFSSQFPKSLTPDAGHEVWNLEMNRYEVDAAAPGLPHRLEAAGYVTGAFTANAFLPAIPGMIAGYQERASSHPILLREEGFFRPLPFLGALIEAWCPPLAEIRPHNTTVALDHYARAFIRRHRDQPFFLWIHYIDPHAPYDPPEPMRRVSEGPWPFFHPYAGGERWGIPILGKNFAVAQEHRDYVRSLYEGEVAYIDAFTGRIVDALDEAGIAGETYFCFTSDHGEELWDHGDWGHGQSLFNEQIHVPLILAGPGIDTRAVPEPVSAIDLVPTLAELMALEPSPTWRGQSLAPVLKGEAAAPPERPIFAHGTTNRAINPMHAVIAGNHKLILRGGADSAVALYDLAADPEERQDLAAQEPEKAEELRQLLNEWLASFPAFFDSEPGGFNRDLEEGLEGMGYL